MKRQIRKKRAGSFLVALLVIAVWSSILLRQQQESRYAWAMEEQGENQREEGETSGTPNQTTSEEQGASDVWNGNLDPEIEQELLGSRYLVIPKNGQEIEEVSLEEDYLHEKLELKLSGIRLGSAGKEAEETEAAEEVEKAEETEKTKKIEEEIEAWTEKILQELESEEPLVTGVESFYDPVEHSLSVSILLDHLYVPFLYEDETSYYIALKRPREVYDKILVIDAGHGGKHPGTMSSDKTYAEKDINLAITLALKELLDTEEEIKVYYTRLTDDSVYLRPRVTLANEAEADFFISIHSNAFWDRKVHGTEVLYQAEEPQPEETQSNKTVITSKQLAKLCLKGVTGQLQTTSRGIWKDEETYILKHSEVPAALIEVAFLTNPDDLELLSQKESQELAAKGIYEAILKAYEE